MTVSQRRARIVRARAVEHRLAALRLAQADGALAGIVRMGERLDGLRAALVQSGADNRGRDLAALGELGMRLDRARASLAEPLANAERVRDHALGERRVAHRNEEGAARLTAVAASREESEAEQRCDANRPWRKRAPMLGAGS